MKLLESRPFLIKQKLFLLISYIFSSCIVPELQHLISTDQDD